MTDANFEYAPYEHIKTVLLSNHETSYWFRDALQALERRDPVDAINDVAVLKRLLEKRFAEMVDNQESTDGTATILR